MYKHKSVKKFLSKFGPELPEWLDHKKLEKEGHMFSMKQIGWFDKVHVYQKLGPMSKTQCRFKWENGLPEGNDSGEYSDLAVDNIVNADVVVNVDVVYVNADVVDVNAFGVDVPMIGIQQPMTN